MFSCSFQARYLQREPSGSMGLKHTLQAITRSIQEQTGRVGLHGFG